MKFCNWDGVETDQENLQDMSTKISVLTTGMTCLSMKLERVLTTKLLTILSTLECHTAVPRGGRGLIGFSPLESFLKF